MKNKKTILIWLMMGIITVILLQYIVDHIVNKRIASSSDYIISIIDEQKNQIDLMLSNIKNNSGTDLVNRIVGDCQSDQRSRFDVLLNKLSLPMTKDELNELSLLFNDCAFYYADLRQLMAVQIYREVGLLESYRTTKDMLFGVDKEALNNTVKLKELADSEIKISELFKELVRLQGKIIAHLSSGKTSQSLEISEVLKQVSAVNREISSENIKNEALRRELQNTELK